MSTYTITVRTATERHTYTAIAENTGAAIDAAYDEFNDQQIGVTAIPIERVAK